MTSRVYGASEDKLLAQLERNLDEARADGASWRVLAALVVGTAVPLAELNGELWGNERVDVRAFGDPEPQYVVKPRSIAGRFYEATEGPLTDLGPIRVGRPWDEDLSATVPRYLTDTDGEDDERASIEFWDNENQLMTEGETQL